MNLPHSEDRRSNCPSQSVFVRAHGNTKVQVVVEEVCRQAFGTFLVTARIQNVMRFFVRANDLQGSEASLKKYK